MCGITYLQRADRQTAESAVDAIRHRGPDSYKVLGDETGYVGAARLAIVDVANGEQPMTTAEGFIGALNGEVYNHRELRKELETRGRIFHTDCDTEVVVNAVAEWGNRAAEKFDGQFAYVVKDPRGKVYSARDHFGVSPLFFGKGTNGLTISSEVPALLKDGVAGQEVRRLPQGCALEFDPTQDNPTLKRYYDVMKHIGHEEADPERLYSLLENAVAKRVPEEVPHATILSGIDSSTVAYFADKQKKKPKMTYTVATEPDSMDVQSARALSRQLGIENRVLMIDEDFVRKNIREAVRIMATPIYFSLINSIPALRLAREVQKDGIKVVLNGSGSDEANIGYDYLWEIFNQKYLEENALNLMGTIGDNECYRDDKVFASQGLEVRPPFLDRTLVEYALSTPIEDRVPELSRTKSKWQLRQAMRGKLPDLIVNRPKDNLYRSTGMMPLVDRVADEMMSDQEYEKYMTSLGGTGWEKQILGGKAGALFHKIWGEEFPELARIPLQTISCGNREAPNFDDLEMLSRYWVPAPGGINLKGWRGNIK